MPKINFLELKEQVIEPPINWRGIWIQLDKFTEAISCPESMVREKIQELVEFDLNIGIEHYEYVRSLDK